MITSEKAHGLTGEEIAFYDQNGYVLAKGVPVNAGITRAIKVVAPAGTITCVKLPGPCVGGQTEFQPRIMELIKYFEDTTGLINRKKLQALDGKNN